MAGTGNLLLRKKVGYAAANDSGLPTTAVLLEGMPAAQLVGLPETVEVNNSGTGLYAGHAVNNVTNRLWIGMNRRALDEETLSQGAGNGTIYTNNGGIDGNNTVLFPAYPSGNPSSPTTQSANRPLWVGAEIRAQTPLVKGGSADPSGTSSPNNTLTYTVLKASWDPTVNAYMYNSGIGWNPSSSNKIFASDTVLVTQKAIYYYVEARLEQTAVAATATYASKTDAAMLGAEGVSKGTQTFLSPISIEQKLTVNGYTESSITYPATIYSDNAEASVFDENVSNLTIGGSASTIKIGNQSTANDTTTTIYGDLSVTGNLNLTEFAVVDGGTY